MMTRAEKDAVVSSIKENIEKAQAVFLTNLVGIPSVDSVLPIAVDLLMHENKQALIFAAVGAHHQNGLAERRIRQL